RINSLNSKKENNQVIVDEDEIESLVVKKVVVKDINKIDLKQSESSLIAKPDVNLVNIYDTYSFSLEHENIDENFKQTITLTSFYKNSKAKNKINVIIKQNNDIKIFDILDLNKGVNLSMESKPIIISIVYSSIFTSSTDRKSVE